MRKLISGLLCVLIFILPLSGCGRKQPEPEGFTIVASIYPVYITLLNLAAGVPEVTVELMTEPATGCLHNYTLLPGDMRKLENCDLLVINGGGMEQPLEDAISGLSGLSVVDASDGIALLDSEAHGEQHEEERDHSGHDHGDGEEPTTNPHLWTSVSRYMEQADNITDGLCAANPENEERYRANRASYREQLEALKAYIEKKLSDVQNRRIITFHEAFDYFAEEFKLSVQAVVESEPGDTPSPRQIKRLIEIVEEHDITVVFIEPQYNNASAKIVAAETGCALLTLDPVVTGKREKSAYLTGMRKNADVLAEALSRRDAGPPFAH